MTQPLDQVSQILGAFYGVAFITWNFLILLAMAEGFGVESACLHSPQIGENDLNTAQFHILRPI